MSGSPSPVKSSKTLPPARFGPLRSQSDRRRHVLEPADVELRLKLVERDQVLCGTLSGYSPSVMYARFSSQRMRISPAIRPGMR